MNTMTGIELIAKERQEQIEKHKRTIQKDSEINNNYELSQVASALCYPYHYADDWDDYPENWDKDVLSKITIKDFKERLIIAGALIAAELDRLEFINSKNKS